jgi:hypothetical protein
VSKYSFFSILSYLDDACIVRIRYLRPLCKKYQELSNKKEEEAFNMLHKRAKVFEFKEYRQVEKIEFISL